jgi:hypothetical protein
MVSSYHHVERSDRQASGAHVRFSRCPTIKQVADLNDPEALPAATAGVHHAERPEQRAQNIRPRVDVPDDYLNHVAPA